MPKKLLSANVLEAAQDRISKVFDEFDKISLSFSGGKDSSVMFHLVADEARRRGRRFSVMFLDWEIQFQLTIDHVAEMFAEYADVVDVHWVALPIVTSNAASMFEPEWTAWDRAKTHVRTPPEIAITDPGFFDFYNEPMTFEEFVPSYNRWVAGGERCACFIGLRTQESLNRWRSINHKTKDRYNGLGYTTRVHGECWNFYPLYDWKTDDIWLYNGRFKKAYNKLYDRMHQAGIPANSMRICEYFSEQSKHSLYLFHVIEPKTWAKILGRVNGANFASMATNEKGRFSGEGKLSLPAGQSWKSYVELLLGSMPSSTAEHYRNKFAVWIKWYQDRGIEISDELPDDLVGVDKPSWRRIASVILRGDYWCSRLSFGPNKAGAYDKYKKLMAKRRQTWDIYGEIK